MCNIKFNSICWTINWDISNDFSILINLNPKLPPDYQDYETVFQIVIKDDSTFQNQARESFKQCKIDGLDPSYVN